MMLDIFAPRLFADTSIFWIKRFLMKKTKINI